MCIRDSVHGAGGVYRVITLALELIELNGSGGVHCINAVSYTHLDVYKRQLETPNDLDGYKAEIELLRSFCD